MAIQFKYDMDTLITDLSAGGFWVREIKTVHSSQGRTIDLHLNNGAVVCWNSESNYLWVEGPRNRINEVDTFFQKLYEGPKSFRWYTRSYNRSLLLLKRKNEAIALWLLRSDSTSARTMRQVIMGLPRIPLKLRRSEPLAVN
jgi:hypothetical protein